ncbi:lysophospholipase catalytic domain-containing protein [Fusarium oxysporum Fo47]|uniref:Lysophospholipase n=1 Tax=Fusarium oxysporum Fo47 TaxID=660027 RepID=W9JF07_FUSOX|nr:lysophospholipase catalytic domain-containing protein [Fusarium oxysporum Fo47]EWZ29054.1 lysophospholipase [Fusarium oxysporum Fo47]QKD57480.1 lysophospholipase catalytic domain-domain-containing protein [Fusarium oxysporum Fo47]
MRCLIALTFWAASTAQVVAAPDDAAAATEPFVNSIDIRALPDSPSGNYAPQVIDCPLKRPTIRLADELSDQENAWVQRRRNNTIDPLKTLLSRANISGFDAESYIDRIKSNSSALPNIAIAVSGGGYRAVMNGAGFLSAADSRNNASGPISGLLQSSTYLAGLSGGGWLVGSIFANNFTTIPHLQRGSNNSAIWRFDRSIFVGPKSSGINILNTAGYWTDISEAVEDKDKGWNTTITDWWGRALSYQLVNASDGGPAYTFSSIAETSNFKNADTPFPILIADGRASGERVISLNATVFEFNPFEFGTWDPTTYGFAPIRYLASNFTNGTISSDDKCVRGFDQLGFIMGTSSSLFNQFVLRNITQIGAQLDIPSLVVKTIKGVLKRLDKDDEDIAQYSPNPFFGWNPTKKNKNAIDHQLTLVDGGEDRQNIPLHPLIQPVRGVDIIFAVDSSADTHSWPNGTALRATYNRVGSSIGNGTLFPSIPSAETFINQRLNQRPTLFGCNADNFTLSKDQSPPPLIFYFPNAPYTTHSNVSTFDMSYSIQQRDDIIENALNGATQGNSTIDKEWPVCVACAIMSRSWWKANDKVPDACNTCFDRYCWNGKSNDTSVGDYEPNFIIKGSSDQEAEDNAASTRLGPSFYEVSALAVAMLSILLW